MADKVMNISLGTIVTKAGLPAANDALLLIPVEASGVEADATIVDYDDLQALFAGSSNEQTTMGRKTISASITITVDDTNNRTDIDIPDQIWTGATGNAISDLILAYDNDTTGGNDSNIVPMSIHDFSSTPDGSDLQATIATAGILRASG